MCPSSASGMATITSHSGLDTGTGQSAGARLVRMTNSAGGGGTGGTARSPSSTLIITTAVAAITGVVTATDGEAMVAQTWQNWEAISMSGGRLSQCLRTGSGVRLCRATVRL